MRTEDIKVIKLADYKPSPYLIPDVSLDVIFGDPHTLVIADLVIEPAPGSANQGPLILDGDELNLIDIRINGRALEASEYVASPDRLEIKSPPPSRFTLEIETSLDPDANKQLSGLYRSNGVFCTQCEAEGFRRITYFLDRPDILSVYTVRLEGDLATAPVLLSNGDPKESGLIHGGRHFAIWHDPHPKPAYLFAMVAGDLDVLEDSFTTMGHHTVKLAIYVEHGKVGMASYAMDALKRSMRWDEEAFGCEYDLTVFNIVAVSDFNMGAMENKGLNIFNDRYILADPDTATDADYARIETVVAHEYFHNWTGNRITCRDWFQLCLKEGLTVYRDQEFSAHERDASVERIANVRLLKSNQFPEDAGPLAHPVRPESYREINNFYTATVYEKGAEIVRMLATLLGEDGFRKGMAHYFHHFDGTAATIEDFVGSFEAACQRDLSSFFNWYRQAGTPCVEVEESFDEARGTLTLTFSQSTPATPNQATKQPVPIPIRFGFVGSQEASLDTISISGVHSERDLLLLEDDRHVVEISPFKERPLVSLLRGFSAPIVLERHIPFDHKLKLLRFESDLFSRWQAAQDLSFDLIKQHLQADDVAVQDAEAYAECLSACAVDNALPASLRAMLLALPSEADISRLLATNIDPDAIHTARRKLLTIIGQSGQAQFKLLYNELSEQLSGPYAPNAQQAGMRALRLEVLSYLEISQVSEDDSLAHHHFATSDNMTDRFGAMKHLVHFNKPQADLSLQAFDDLHGTSALAMDKWFTVQATKPHSSALETVQSLTDHRLFSLQTPNRVRALIGAFATLNPTQFNRRDGAGFEYVASTVGALDPANPQVAARLLTAFRSWRALEPERRCHAHETLVNLKKTSNLSRDTSDILDRILSESRD